MKVITHFIIILSFLLILSTAGVAASNSLWSEESADMYEDRKAFKKGDIITVTISENASAIQSANTDSSQSSSVGAGGGTGLMNFLESFGLEYSDEDSADGQTGRQGTFEADITTQIVEIKENGNFKIEGEKKITINEEEQILTLAGVIRPEDISLENNISSRKVAQAEIGYKGKGPIAHKQKQGILSWLLGWIF